MRLRKLEEKDAPLMLEWMHDPSVVKYMQADFASKTIDDCVDFIKSAADRTTGIHFAVVDDNDEYMGTVSLKHITDNDAEFAITVRKAAMGRGFSTFAMKEIIEYGFNTLNLNSIYWCVRPENKRAVRFYDKNGYKRVILNGFSRGGYSPEQIQNYIWYRISKTAGTARKTAGGTADN